MSLAKGMNYPGISEDAMKVARWFCKLTDTDEKGVFLSDWARHAQNLLDNTGYTKKEVGDFIKWAVTENISDNPKFNSVAYINSAKDKFATFMKHSENLLLVFNRNKAVATKVSAAKDRQTAVRLLPRSIAKWLMTGPGVNQPVGGWESARQKLDAVKCSWYGKGWESQPDPDIDMDSLFAEHASKSGIRKEHHA